MICVRCGKPATQKHHRMRRSQGGTDDPVNLADVCVECHNWIHANPYEAYANGLLVPSWEEVTPLEMKPPEQPPEHEHVGECKICHQEIRPRRKPRSKRKAGDPPARVWSVAAPKDDPEAVERLKEKVEILNDRFNDAGHEIGKTVTLERALDYTLMNAGQEDF